MIRMVSVKCPECNAALSIEENRKHCFCQYCGTKIMVDDGSTMHTYRKVDEARIKEAEVNESIRLSELMLEEKKYADKKRAKAFKVKASIVLGIVGSILLVVGFLGGEATGNPDSGVYMISFIGMFALMAIAFIWLGGSDKKDD